MAVPTAPTVTTLTTEGLKRAGISNPSSTELTRAADWMEEIKDDIQRESRKVGKKLQSLHQTSILVLTTGRHRYSLPTDYHSELTGTLLNGDTTGTAQDGAVGSVTLASDEDITQADIQGKYILITSGTGKGSFSQCTTYSTTTKIATVEPDFTTAPVNGDGYMVIDEYRPLKEVPIRDIDELTTPTLTTKPEQFSLLGDADFGEIVFEPTPDATYGMQLRYYADMSRLDLTSTTVSTLYRKWRNIWIQGVKMRAFEDQDDNRYQLELNRYMAMIGALIEQEGYAIDPREFQMQL